MIAERFERRLPDLMHELAAGDERYIDDILARTAQTRQRPAWSFPTRWMPAPAVLGRLPAYQNRLVFVLLLVAMLALLVGTAALIGDQGRRELPSSRVTNGWIAFSAHTARPADADRRKGPMAVYLAQEGMATRRIAGSTGEPTRAVCPSFSPDGTRLAYAEATEPDAGVINNSFVWAARSVVVVGVSPDGALTSPPIRIAVMPDDRAAMSTGTAALTEPCPEWSPDGQQLAFVEGPEARLRIVHLDGSTELTPTQTPPVTEFEWSPDGAFIATSGPSGFWIWPADGQPGHQVQTEPMTVGSTPSGLGWSPDGKLLATTLLDDGLCDSVRLLPADAAGPPVDLGPGLSPVWSPAGDRIAFHATGGQAGCRAESDAIVIVVPDGGDRHEIPLASLGAGAAITSPIAWSPDGERLVYAGYLGTSNATGDGPSVVTLSSTGDAAPSVLAPELTGVSDTGISWQGVYP